MIIVAPSGMAIAGVQLPQGFGVAIGSRAVPLLNARIENRNTIDCDAERTRRHIGRRSREHRFQRNPPRIRAKKVLRHGHLQIRRGNAIHRWVGGYVNLADICVSAIAGDGRLAGESFGL